jgi:hypothetical protein
MADLHLSRAELTAWRDESAGDRGRIVTHLAACAVCRAMAADLERERPGGDQPERFEAGSFAARGYQVGRPDISRAAPRWVWATAAAALVAVVVVPVWLARVGNEPAVIRGTDAAIALVRPAGDASVTLDALAFEWSGPSPDARVRLNVIDLDRPAEPLIEREVTGSRYEPTPEERGRFGPGQSLHWYVEALDGSGNTSATARFRVQ